MPLAPHMRNQGAFGRQMMGPGRFPHGGLQARQGFPPGPFHMNPGGFPAQPGMQPGMGPGPFRGRQNNMPGQQGKGAGLLSRLFGKRNAQQGRPVQMPVAGKAEGDAGGSLFRAIGNPEKINTFISNTQNVINAAQSLTPLLEQYGPLVKNIPALWKLYRGLKDSGEDNNATSEENEAPNKAAESGEPTAEMSPSSPEFEDNNSKPANPKSTVQNSVSTTKRSSEGKSVPKLFI